MSFLRHLKVASVIELKSTSKNEAIRELTNALCKAAGIRKQKQIVEDVLKREESASTFVGQGIAIPHARTQLTEDFAIAVGRSLMGIDYDAARKALAHFVVLVLSNETLSDGTAQINLLSEIVTCFKSDPVREQLLIPECVLDLKDVIASQGKTGPVVSPTRKMRVSRKPSDPILSSAEHLASETGAGAIIIFADAVRDNDFLEHLRGKHKVIIITSNKTRFAEEDTRFAACIQAPPFLSSRIGQLKIGLLLALTRNIVDKKDRVVCVSGNMKNGTFDTLVALDVAAEYEFFLTASQTVLPPDIKPEVLERVLGLAGEIAVEGREGRPTGAIFVIGDTNSVNMFARQLIINPFRGYSEAERNIMDPALDETIKEFASIDGAFIITGDGIVIAAGSYLRPQAEVEVLPSGLGARHAAAAAITACTNSLAITISESTGNVTLFKGGAILMSLTRPAMRRGPAARP